VEDQGAFGDFLAELGLCLDHIDSGTKEMPMPAEGVDTHPELGRIRNHTSTHVDIPLRG
jgi:hypothetical protein